jgi:hypothetical protein
MNDFFSWDPSNPNYTSYSFTTSTGTFPANYTYTINLSDSAFYIKPDLVSIYDKADKEFDAMEDQTSIAKQLLNDIGITWNDKE